MSIVTLRVNGATHEVDIDPSTPLLYVLRNDLGLKGPRFGCGLAQCGTCTVIVDGVATRSCILPASSIAGEITTLEGLARDGRLDPLQQAWIDEQVPQCGYCQNGQIMTARALLDRNPRPTDAEIVAAMDGVLCRCMTYYRIRAAIKRAVRGATAVAADGPGAERGPAAYVAAESELAADAAAKLEPAAHAAGEREPAAYAATKPEPQAGAGA